MCDYTPSWLREEVTGVQGAGSGTFLLFMAPGRGESSPTSGQLGRGRGRREAGEWGRPFLLVLRGYGKSLAFLESSWQDPV